MKLGPYCPGQIELDRLGQQAVLHLPDPPVERLRALARLDSHTLLGDHWACVHALVEEVDGDAGLLGAGRERLSDRAKARESGQERRVHVDAPEAREEAGCEELHVPCADHELDASLLEPVRHRLVAVGTEARSARSRACTPAVFDATAETGSAASRSACRFVPVPETRTPITRAGR